MELATVMSYTLIAAALLIGFGALGTAIGFALLGGKVIGSGWQARVLPGGTDYQLIIGDTLAVLDRLTSGPLVLMRKV